MSAGNRERASVIAWIGQLEHHAGARRPNTTRPLRFTHGMPKTFDTRASGCQAVSASQMSS